MYTYVYMCIYIYIYIYIHIYIYSSMYAITRIIYRHEILRQGVPLTVDLQSGIVHH